MQKSEWYRFILGCVIVAGLLALSVAIALGEVQEKSSYGLTAILAILAKIALDFSEWAFRSGKNQIATPEDKKETEVK